MILRRGVEDTWWWEGEPNGGFSVKSTYSYLYDEKYDSQEVDIFETLWKLKVPPKVVFVEVIP